MQEKFARMVEEIKKGHEESRPLNLAKELQGQRFFVSRAQGEPVEAICYRKAEGILPVFFNMHGGGFIGGDAVLMDSFCADLVSRLPICVINVNYKKAPEYPFPYAVNEVYDLMDNMAKHADEYRIDPARMAVGGHSAGANLAAAASLMAADRNGPALRLQMLDYPCVDLATDITVRNPDSTPEEAEGMRMFVALYCQHEDAGDCYASPLLAPSERLAKVCPAAFITCGPDALRPEGEEYAKKLIDCGVSVSIRRYEEALHGFVEVNRPDYPEGDPRKNSHQLALCKEAEQFICQQLEMALCR